MEMFNNPDSLKAYINRESKIHDMSSQRGYIYYFARQFLTNLFQSSDIFTITGNTAQSTILSGYVRPISDIDIISGESIDDIVDQFHETLKVENNGIAYSLVNRPTIGKNGVCNATIKGTFGKIEQPIGLDIKSEAPRKAIQGALPKLFSLDDDLEIQAVSHEAHLGRKLYVIARGLHMMSQGYRLSRFKDFYDVYKMSNIPYDFDTTREYYQELMAVNGIPDSVHGIMDDNFIVAVSRDYDKSMKSSEVKNYNIVDEVYRVRVLMTSFDKKNNKGK